MPPVRRAHPRTRGENPTGAPIGISVAGSPPHTRGKPAQGGSPVMPSRLTPAHAGKTQYSYSSTTPFKAHPRTRGENFSGPTKGIYHIGSPPHTRGKLYLAPTYCNTLRLTPAHAGKTKYVVTVSELVKAHPRTRGENDTCGAHAGGLRGSPPHTRGKRKEVLNGSFPSRLTPAHAGKTLLYCYETTKP